MAYVNIAPSARYESLTKKYRIHVTREFVNKNGAAVPTEVRFSWSAGFLGPIMMVLVAVRFYRRRRKKLALRAAAGGFVHYDAYEDETDEDGFYSVRLFETDAQSADILDPAEFYIVEFAPDDDLAETIDSVQDVAADIDAGEDDFEIEEWL